MTKSEEIIESLKPLFEKATTEKLWFFCSYQDLWFTPAELQEHHRNGKFVWGEVNWQLRKPDQRIKQIDAEIERLQSFKRHLQSYGYESN